MSIEKELYEVYWEMRCYKIKLGQLAYKALEEGNECLAATYMGKMDCISEYAKQIERILQKHDVRLFPDENIFRRVWFRLTHIGR